MTAARVLLLVVALLAVGFTGLVGYGQWSEDACITSRGIDRIPEGSSGTQETVAWPPGAVRCHWRLPSGGRRSYTVTIW